MSPPLLTRRVCGAIALPAALFAAAYGVLQISQDGALEPSVQRSLLRKDNHPMSDAAMHARAIGVKGFTDPTTVNPRGPWWEAEKHSWWDDIDYDVAVPCGVEKCFFTSASDPGHGYVLEKESWEYGTTGHSPRYQKAREAYLYEKELESTYGIRGTSMSQPILLKVPEYFKEQVTKRHMDSKAHNIANHGYVVVQPVHKAPDGSVLYKCNLPPGGCGDVSRWIEAGHGPMLAGELQALIPLLDSHPELSWDFQVLIDPEGRVYHIDLSRAMQKQGTLHRVHEFEKMLEGRVAEIRSALGVINVADGSVNVADVAV